MKPLGEAASELPWIMPGAASLLALTRSEPDWNLIRRDPGALLLVLRAEASQSDTAADPATSSPMRRTAEVCGHTEVLSSALSLMEEGKYLPVAWDIPGRDFVYRSCLEIATLAEALTARLPRCDGEHAWMAGFLAPLGWLAISDARPRQTLDQVRALQQSTDTNSWQHASWGMDHAALVRRLCRGWKLPSWLAAVIGHLGLPIDIAARLGAEPILFQTVQLALALRQRDQRGLALPVGATVPQLLSSLDLSRADVEQLVHAVRELSPPALSLWEMPGKKRLLKDVVRLALKARSSESASDEPGLFEDKQLQELKLSALAELAAGAGHEINNPLAVISGQAQYIARQLEQARSLIPEEPALEEYLETLQAAIQGSLKTIRGQSQRINQVLTNLMQYARPAAPQLHSVSVSDLAREAVAAVQDLAHVQKIRLTCQEAPETWRVRIDRGQMRAALACLLRNAVEAAPAEGWVRLLAEKADDNRVLLYIDDSGPGPSPQAQDHMFDPFYSGRSAGRGQGLGLPIAWSLARQQGGEVSFGGHTGGVTRFILSLPAVDSGHVVESMHGSAMKCSA